MNVFTLRPIQLSLKEFHHNFIKWICFLYAQKKGVCSGNRFSFIFFTATGQKCVTITAKIFDFIFLFVSYVSG